MLELTQDIKFVLFYYGGMIKMLEKEIKTKSIL